MVEKRDKVTLLSKLKTVESEIAIHSDEPKAYR